MLWDDKKVTGVLVDVHGEATGPLPIVLIVGVNGYIGSHDAAQIDQPWTDLHTITGKLVDRTAWRRLFQRSYATCSKCLPTRAWRRFATRGNAHHRYHGQRVRLLAGSREITGTVEGIDDHGALLLRRDARGVQAFHSGDISLRRVA